MKNINGWIVCKNRVAHSGCHTIPCGFISRKFAKKIIDKFIIIADDDEFMAENLDKIYPDYDPNCGIDGEWLNNWIENVKAQPGPKFEVIIKNPRKKRES